MSSSDIAKNSGIETEEIEFEVPTSLGDGDNGPNTPEIDLETSLDDQHSMGYIYEQNPIPTLDNLEIDPYKAQPFTEQEYNPHPEFRAEQFESAGKGSFSIPNVGSQLWCFFSNNDPNLPVYFASTQPKESWNAIYNHHADSPSTSYPGSYENHLTPTSEDSNTSQSPPEPYRNMYVINQKGGHIKFDNTDELEEVKIGHYSGSNIQWLNSIKKELVTTDESKGVLGHSWQNYFNNKIVTVQKDSTERILGNRSIFIGDFSEQSVQASKRWKQIASEIGDIQRLFDTNRTDNYNYEKYIKETASKYKDNDNLLGKVSKDILSSLENSSRQKQSGEFAPCPACATANIFNMVKQNSPVVIPTLPLKVPPPCSIILKDGFEPGILDNVVPPEFIESSAGIIFGEVCPTCNGSGFSPSSQDGIWTRDETKSNIVAITQNRMEEFLQEEENMGSGGNNTVTIQGDNTLIVGTTLNEMGSFRTDPKGRISTNQITIHPEGTFDQKLETPITEYVQVKDFPGGTYTQIITNRNHTIIGAGGSSVNTIGPIDFHGGMFNVTGEMVSISSKTGTHIDGGSYLKLSADNIDLETGNKQLSLGGGLGVSKNLIVGGGTHLEGEVTLQHATVPREVQVTYPTHVHADITKPDIPIGYVDVPGVGRLIVFSLCTSGMDLITTKQHKHYFDNMPLTFKETSEEVRKEAMINNDNDQRTPSKSMTVPDIMNHPENRES